MAAPARWVVVGLDNGGTMNNATVLDSGAGSWSTGWPSPRATSGRARRRRSRRWPGRWSRCSSSPGSPRAQVRAVGLDTPGPVSADGVIALQGATNFGDPALVRL